MNLTGDPWVPVVFATGENRLVGLSDAFRHGQEILDLVAAPPQRIALTRLLVCIAQAALDGPEDEQGWRSCRGQIMRAALGYLESHKDCFELYGDDAFLQVPNLVPTDNATLDKFDFGLAAGNNAVLFDHGASAEGRARSPAWSALMLLTYQCFSPGGRIGVSDWGGSTTSGSSEHAPCLEGSMLHTIIRGGCLLDTVHMNLVTKEMVKRAPGGGWGTPVWESMPERPEGPRVAAITDTYLGRLVPISRGIKLVEGSKTATLANGCAYPKLPRREPGATVVRRGKDEVMAYVGIGLSKHPWRELGSVLALSHSPAEGGPWVLSHLVGGDGQVDLWTGGLAANKGKLLDAAEWSFHLPLALIGDAALNKYRQGVELAERANNRLWSAVSACFEDLAVGEFKRNDQQTRKQRQRVLAKASASYWRTVDGSYGVLIETANELTAELAGEWYTIVRAAMDQAYERACPHETARQIRAYAKGAQRLRLRKPGQREAA